jgi:hypothetical protein
MAMFLSRFQCLGAAAALLICLAIVPAVAAQSTRDTTMIRGATESKYQLSAEDHDLLEAVQRGCFNFLWNETGVPARLTKDRRTTLTASVAGVGFQLSSIPIGVERGWITRDEGRHRALTVLKSLADRKDNRRFGMLLHFVNADTGGIYPPFNNELGSVDQALFLAGAMTAGSYFGGEIAELTDRFLAETNWKSFAVGDEGFISLAWKLHDSGNVDGPGSLMDAAWRYASDEEHITYFLAVGCPTPEFAVAPELYYRLQRVVKRHGDMQPYVVSPTGALFHYFFSHCWIDYGSLGPDDPAAFGCSGPRVDWFENSRRASLAHRQRCIDESGRYKTFAPDRWGLAPCMGQPGDRREWGYLVPDVRPNAFDSENLLRGTVAPYAAGSAVMFVPRESLAAMRAFRDLKTPAGEPLVWRDPAKGGYAFADSFNLDQMVACDDNVAIDAGPLILAIENARTGLVWRLFMEHPSAQAAVERLKLGK